MQVIELEQISGINLNILWGLWIHTDDIDIDGIHKDDI